MTLSSIHDLAETYDLVVVGAGPAGLSAATTAADHGLSVLLIDENASIGGQIYRSIGTTPVQNKAILGQDYWRGATLAGKLAASSTHLLSAAVVWSIRERTSPAPRFEIAVSWRGLSRLIGTGQCILATGAMERPFPVPGWTLPGVMTAGAAQTLLKASGLIPDGKIVLAGSGPLLYVLAQEIAAAGGQLTAVLDTTPRSNWRSALPWFPAFLSGPYGVKGLRLWLSAKRSTRFLTGITGITLQGTERGVDRVRFQRQTGNADSLPADGVLLHQGVIPDINLASAAGCALDWDPLQLCWFPRTDESFQSSVANLAIAGDGSGIGGAEAAVIAGRIAALGALHRLDRLAPYAFQPLLSEQRHSWARRMSGRAFIDRLYQPAKQFRIPADSTITVCRCEEVTAGRIRQTIADGCSGPNQLKAFLRCGMGACQGRLCGTTVSELIADERGISPAEVGHFHLRPPVKPITMAELAALQK